MLQIYRFKERTGSHYVGLMGLALVPSSTLETDCNRKEEKEKDISWSLSASKA